MNIQDIIGSIGLFIGLFVLSFCIIANYIRQNPKWLQCRRCHCFRNELGTHQVSPPPNIPMMEIDEEELCDLCSERLQAKARQHHNCCH